MVRTGKKNRFSHPTVTDEFRPLPQCGVCEGLITHRGIWLHPLRRNEPVAEKYQQLGRPGLT